MDSESERSSSSGKWWLLAVGVLIFVVIITWLEGLGRTDSEGATPAGDAATAAPPAPPEVLRLEDGGIQIRHDPLRKTTIRLVDEDKEQALYDCLTQGIKKKFGSGTDSWSRARVERETLQIQFECLRTLRATPESGAS